MPSEMFPPTTRGKAVGFAIASNWLTNFIVALITPRIPEVNHFWHFLLLPGFQDYPVRLGIFLRS
ncbi:hypothetical protein V1517DRAFT_79442 [Lipomyces orientalis]|uniref:Uncharacterized protein n=1 Tax=Lipomyces orientalis TaxID=1233043 RepID=A0ACC3TD20_9ASCO